MEGIITGLFITVSILGLVGQFVCLIYLRRNSHVYDYRMKLIEEMSEAAVFDNQMNRPSAWRAKVFNSVSYNDMVKKFWIPLDKFYPDKSFTLMQAKGPKK